MSSDEFLAFNEFLDSVIARLKETQKDKDAYPFFDHMSGAFIWSDERILGLKGYEMGCLRAIFRYRTNLIVQEDDKRFESLWADLKAKYPDWIGFSPERCSPNHVLLARYKEIRSKPLV